MSDDELIARLRDGCNLQQRDGERAAKRIEALTKERDEADDLAKAAFADGASNNIRLAETSYRVKWLEAKLAKAVEAGQTMDDGCDCERCNKARATLAKIKGESHE